MAALVDIRQNRNPQSSSEVEGASVTLDIHTDTSTAPGLCPAVARTNHRACHETGESSKTNQGRDESAGNCAL